MKLRSQQLRFLTVGAIATGVDAMLFALLVAHGTDARLANIMSYALSAIAAFWLHRNWTFVAHDAAAAGQAFRFLVMIVLGLTITTTLIWLMAPVVGPFAAKLIAIIGSVSFNFVVCRWLVFAPRRGGRLAIAEYGDASCP